MIKGLKNKMAKSRALQEGNEMFRSIIMEAQSPDEDPNDLHPTQAGLANTPVVESGDFMTDMDMLLEDTMFDSDLETRLEIGEDIVDNFNHPPATDLRNRTDFNREVDILDDLCIDVVNDFVPNNKLAQEVDYNDNTTAPPAIETLSESYFGEDLDFLAEQVSDLEGTDTNLHSNAGKHRPGDLLSGQAEPMAKTFEDAIAHESGDLDLLMENALSEDKVDYDLPNEYQPVHRGILSYGSALPGGHTSFNEETETVDEDALEENLFFMDDADMIDSDSVDDSDIDNECGVGKLDEDLLVKETGWLI